MTVKTTK